MKPFNIPRALYKVYNAINIDTSKEEGSVIGHFLFLSQHNYVSTIMA